VQTVIGAEIGAIALWRSQPEVWLSGIQSNEQRHVATVGVEWLAAVVGAILLLRLAGPTGWWKTAIALLLLFPLFLGLTVDNVGIYPNNENLIRLFGIVALVALIASTVVRLKRPETT
jgi:hypothetical protein